MEDVFFLIAMFLYGTTYVLFLLVNESFFVLEQSLSRWYKNKRLLLKTVEVDGLKNEKNN